MLKLITLALCVVSTSGLVTTKPAFGSQPLTTLVSPDMSGILEEACLGKC